MKKIKYLIITVLTIIIILILILLVYLKINNNQNQDENITENIEEKEVIQEGVYNKVNDNSKFFNVANYITTYFDYINKNNTSYYGINEKGEQIKTVSDDAINKNIYNILSEEYIEKNNIKNSNVKDYIPNVDKKLIFVPLKENILKDGNIEKYVVYGIVENIDYTFVSDIYIIVNVDNINQTFSIEPTSNKYTKLEEIEKENTIKQIEQNNNNKAISTDITKQYICTQYLNTYKRLALSNTELAYSYFDKNYKDKRFENIDRFKKYIEDNKDEIKALTLSKFLINEKTGEYVCQDKYENTYVFDATNIMDFTMKLDTYTIPSQEFIDTYTKASDEDKVALNTNIYIKMINSRDYSGIYKLLDDSFKKSHNLNEDDFIKYMKGSYQKHYDYESVSISKQQDVYIQKINITDITKQEDFKTEQTIMMQLKENLEFKVSFNFIGF